MLGRATVAAATALVLTALSSPAAWAADPAPVPTPSVTAESAQPAESAQTEEIRSALRKAVETGKPVRIDSMTNETTEVFADTDGRSLYSDTNAQDVRTKRDGAWRTLDPTLRGNADGTVTPALTGSDLVLSGGGDGPLAKITTADGTSMSIGAPFPLPKPTLNGATATYASVLPDVDLRVTARPDGGWRDVIVVKTAQAAADPKLKTLHFPLETDGVKADTDAAGNVSFKDAQGKVRFHAPTPFQWDSSTPPDPAPLVKSGRAQARSLFTAPAVEDQAPAGTSTAERPGTGAVVSTIAIVASDTELVLTPDPATFGQGAGPWYLDPETSVDKGATVNAQVQENHPDTANVNTLSALGVGYCGYSDCSGYGRYRAYYQIPSPDGLFEGGGHGTATVNRATLFTNVVDASSPGTKSTLNVYSAPAFQGTTTWNNQPCGTNGKMTGCTWAANADITGTGSGQIAWDVTWWMQKIVNEKIPNWTIGISAENENDKLLRHHLGSNAHIVTYYDITPTIWYPRTSPTPGFTNDPLLGTQVNDCQTPGGGYAWYAPGWVGANQYVYLNASAWSPIGAGTTVNFHIWDDNDSSWHAYPSSGGAGSYGNATVSVDRLTDGHQYGWAAAVTDGQLSSGTTPACYLRVDRTPPRVSIASDDFPASGTIGAVPKKKAGQDGTLTLSAQDPAPAAGLNASGVACIRWSTDPTAVTGWSCNATGTKNKDGVVKGSSGPITFAPPRWGTNTLYVQAMDVAGNYSQPLPYTFYAPWDASTAAGAPGDLDGDGRGDALVPDDLGNLRVVGLDSDMTAIQGAPVGLAPGGTSWKSNPTTGLTVRTTHLGALRQPPTPVDDTVVWTNAVSGGTSLASNLYLYQNNGDGTFKAPVLLNKPDYPKFVGPTGGTSETEPPDWTYDWSKLTQVVALGRTKAPASTGETKIPQDQTALLTVENGNLWLYRTLSTNDVGAPIVKVSAANWDGYELINPGAASGTAQPTLWTRDKKDGTIRAYDITLDANGRLNFGNLVDPTSKARTLGTQKFTVAAYPQLGSSGDATKDGLPDLWALDTANHLKVWPGTGTTTVTGFAATPYDQGDSRRTVGRLKLTDPGSSVVTDVYGKNPMTAGSAVTFPADTVNGKSTTVAHFAGGTAGADSLIAYGTSQNDRIKVDTTKSFTISVWAKPAGASGSVLSTKGSSSSGFILWPDSDGTWHFGMATADNTGWNYHQTSEAGTSAAAYQAGRWDHLTASYNAATGGMSLYVNGVLAGSAYHRDKFGYSAPLMIGSYQHAGASTSATAFSGNVSDVELFDVPTDPSTATSRIMADLPTAVGTNKCLDANGSVDANGTAIQVWDCNPSTAQQATMQPNGTVKLLSRCLDVTGAATGNGTKIQLWTCDGNPAQQWLYRADGSLYNPMSGRCLDIPNGTVANGTQLQIWDCNRTYPQRWGVGAAIA
ncbi:concanavalin A-like lectin/glucanase superfamily protein [Kitasatospora sp. SolWspMP-SS2h]|uniref:ricin-type beta-trefoil lectin domain protein n=1 Tax=Kitasatospora sp. SolWspMP-SS2h TaxID=1305729 RepID=UPI000DB95E6B|nr:ricin-type beta-trefoil lectin domain protein [Kitasatospora sp. SolWspMP-SS2h]RAJ33557.1 concanavalin A-like lectin/glucanase superfamily protein [Kitasatospora sp. SolWspMP-SS2h]